MAALVRVTGTRQVTPIGSSGISTPRGNIILDSTSTVATADLSVGKNLFVKENVTIGKRITVSSLDRAETDIVIKPDNTANVGNPLGIPYDPFDVYEAPYGNLAQIAVQKELRREGGAYFPGGVGIEKDLNVGGRIYGRITFASTSNEIIVTATNVDAVFYPTFVREIDVNGIPLNVDTTGTFSGLTYNPGQGLFTVEKEFISATTQSNSTLTGALVVSGGVGIAGNLNVGQNVNIDGITTITNTTQSLSSLTGALQVQGGTGIRGNLNVGQNASIGGITTITNTTQAISTETGALQVQGGASIKGNVFIGQTATISQKIIISDTSRADTEIVIKSDNTANVGNPLSIPYDPLDVYEADYGNTGQIDAQKNLRKQGGAYFPGGVGIEKDLNVGGRIYGRITQAITSTEIIVTATNIDAIFYPTFVRDIDINGIALNADTTGTFSGLTYNPGQGLLTVEKVRVSATTTATSTLTGALVVAGGVGISGNIYIGQNANIGGITTVTNTTNAVSTTTGALQVVGGVGIGEDLHVNDIYTKFINSINEKLTMRPAPADPFVEVQGNIRVLGDKPIGTAPVITNVLYVTVDGDDTNDGRAEDASRACRTINGAINSPYYQPGTQILVAAGHYLEDNPLRLKPYTSVRGSDIRTTFIEPINKTQDLFHLESGCYLNYMTFLNGRSGLLDGPYDQRFNRGAYATAFPPLTGSDRIDLFHSPYVQNCTNQSGPWLKDGTMFVPSQTVQVPTVVGTGTWILNTTSIIVNASTGTITQGMYINAGQQNPGFFNARTLMLASKPFLQEQVVAYVNQEVAANVANTTSIWYGFTYSQEKCFRDVGILVENVAYDAAFGGNEKSVESGLAYYNGVVSLIEGQEEQTNAAINYLNSLTQQVIVNTTCTDLLSGTGLYQQERNIVLTGGEIASNSINALFFTITNIITYGSDVAPPVYNSTGPDAAFVSAEILMQANRKFIQEDTVNYINNIVKNFPYSKIKCKRDTGLIVDSISLDLLYPTTDNSQSTFAGLQYYNQASYTGSIAAELTATVAAIDYLKTMSGKVVLNITTATDAILGIDRFSTGTQITSFEAATDDEVIFLDSEFDIIIDILNNGNIGWTDRIIPNGSQTNFISPMNAVTLLQANKEYLKDEVIAFVTASTSTGGLGFFAFNTATCRRDIGYIIDSVSFDLLHGGNKQAVQSGLYYYGVTATNIVIEGQSTATTLAYDRIKAIVPQLISNTLVTTSPGVIVEQNVSLPAATVAESNALVVFLNTITNIITNGPSVAAPASPISLVSNTNTNVKKAYDIIVANRSFIQDEVIAYIDNYFNAGNFNYNEEKCYRDVGLIVDAVSQDILLGGNQKSIEAGLSYWNAGFNYVAGQVSTTTAAISHAESIALQIIANTAVTPQTGTEITQIINPFFQYGGDYMPQQAVSRNFNIIKTIIEQGPEYAPPVYAGGGLFALTGLNGADVKISPRVTSVQTITTGTYRIGLNTSTIGFGNNATLYFGDVFTFPLTDAEVEARSLEYSGTATTWNSRKVDPIGSMGGSLVDGAVISSRSPIQSFVYDAFTQVNQGGRGVHIKNDGYAQLVSVFTIFCSIGVEVESGGIASIVNSNANFGDICLLARGYGKRKFSGTVYNPRLKAYPTDPEFDQYYPAGFWPNDGQVLIFTPDIEDRPHISLVMEVVPPEIIFDIEGTPVPQTNDQGLPGFLNAAVNTGTITTGSIVINGINTDGIAVGNYVYIRDQENSYTGTNGLLYTDTGTIVTNIGYQSVTLNKALTSGGFDPEGPNDLYFDIYFCGNAYYTVLSSTVANNPRNAGTNILTTASGAEIATDQVAAHIQAISHLSTCTLNIISNTLITPTTGNSLTQFTDQFVIGGGDSTSFISLRYNNMINIINAADINAAEAVVPKRLRIKEGTPPTGAGAAVTLIEANIDFLAEEVNAYVKQQNPSLVFNELKCKRDIRIILQRLIYDLESGGNYNSVMNGLSYWSRNGTHHIVQLGENVRRNDLFPDGATVNFYQRSYMSASGYVFEYVGAGTNYGALPQRGRADPVQGKETVQLDSGKVFFTSTDQNGDFRIGPGLVISQATGVLSGRTFTKSLFANMTPFILAIEGS